MNKIVKTAIVLSLCIIGLQSYAVLPRSLSELSVKSAIDIVTTDNSDDNDSKFSVNLIQNILTIKYSKPQELLNGEAIVYNLLGKEIARKKLEVNVQNQMTIPTQNTCYIVRINYSGKVYTQKVITQQSN